MADAHLFPVRVYYEDTDHSGLVYHANYLKFMERAREHCLGIDLLLKLTREDGIAFVVYKTELTYREGAEFGDELVVRTTAACHGEYRLVMHQDVLRPQIQKVMVAGLITLVCVDTNRKLVSLPSFVVERFGEA